MSLLQSHSSLCMLFIIAHTVLLYKLYLVSYTTIMTTDIKTYIVNELCTSIADVIKTALNDHDEESPYLTSSIQLLETLHRNNIEVDLSIFTDT